MRVLNLMTSSAASVTTDDALSTAARLMWERDCGAIPVLDPSTDRCVGMITDRDICMATWSKGRAPEQISVVEAMSTGLVSCSPNDSVGVAQGLMQSHKIRRLPVVDADQRLLGIISLADIARNVDARRTSDPELTPERLAATFAAVAEERRTRRPQATAA